MKKDKKFNVFTPLNGKRSRKSKKFPRAKINVEEHENYSMRGSHIKCGDFIEADERFPYVRRNEICRYINSRLGENLDDVLSDVVKKVEGLNIIVNDGLELVEYVIFIPGQTEEDNVVWCPFTIDSEKRIIKNPKKNKNWKIGRW